MILFRKPYISCSVLAIFLKVYLAVQLRISHCALSVSTFYYVFYCPIPFIMYILSCTRKLFFQLIDNTYTRKWMKDINLFLCRTTKLLQKRLHVSESKNSGYEKRTWKEKFVLRKTWDLEVLLTFKFKDVWVLQILVGP